MTPSHIVIALSFCLVCAVAYAWSVQPAREFMRRLGDELRRDDETRTDADEYCWQLLARLECENNRLIAEGKPTLRVGGAMAVLKRCAPPGPAEFHVVDRISHAASRFEDDHGPRSAA